MKAAYKLLASAFLISAISSCQIEEISSDQVSDNIFTFYANSAENQTRTIRQDDGAVWWDTDENIKVFCNGIAGKFTSENSEPSETATFTGGFASKITKDDISIHGIMALYPYQEDATCDGESITFTVPDIQVAAKGTFSKGQFPCIARSHDTSLSFYNVCSGIKFSVTNDDIRSVTFKANGGEHIAGLVEVDFLYDDMPTGHIQEGQSEITVYAPDNGYFEPGVFYYIIMLPPLPPTEILWDGFTVTYNKDNISDSITINEKVQLPRSKFGIIEGKDEGLLFVDYEQPIEFADPVMKEQCVAAFDINGDGELSYAEARAVTDLSKMVLTNKTFKSFDEFQYFTSVKRIPSYYFEYSNIKSIILPPSVTQINYRVFADCSNLTSIYIPDSVTTIDMYAFYNCSSLTRIDIPHSVTSIGDFAFSGCSSLASIVLPDGVTSIGQYAFSDCSSLASIILPDGVTSIGQYAFSDCSSLASIVLPDGVASIGQYAFSDCSSLASIILPDGVTSIGWGAFSGCSSLASIILPDGVTSIGKKAFSDCSSLTSIILPDGVTSIGDYAFSDCSSLTSVILPDGVTSIGESAFSGCSSLTSIIIPEGVTSIGKYAFSGCSSLTSIILPDGVTSIGQSAFSDCSSLTSIIIPDGVTSIGKSAFYDCSSLTSIVLPDGVTSIGQSAFSDCSSLTSIIIPDGVTAIGGAAFCDCSSLANVYLKPLECPVLSGSYTNITFYNNSKDRKIYVPAESLEAYKAAEGWSTYADAIVGYDYENDKVVE